ncbi:methyl-accepting chemotaxis protein [Paenibacillus sp. YPG26]|uniref:methyl-accepting chemotaxis protein n=1 Tax=Paenibacillus sp. YPG26 TaxID=2878915 RepID=UPI0023EEB8E2|nr:methyl-accepting chemotaxis protein [Paenibacillus sp. YPG26]
MHKEGFNYHSSQVLNEKSVLAAIERSLAMIEFDIQGNVLWVNENFARAMGYTAAEMPGMHHQSFCTPEFIRSPEYSGFWANFKKGYAFQEKIMRVAKDGRILWLEATYTPIYNEDGEVHAVLKIATDITYRENATTRLTSELQNTAEDLLRRAAAGVARSQEVEAVMGQVAKEAHDNLASFELLEKQSNSIRGIVKTVRDIANRTNLLALNAAIEAAHAGEHGRGFNVVAGEVRKLAQQVQEAIQEVNSYTEGITSKVLETLSVTQRSQTSIEDSQTCIRQAVDEFLGIGEAARQLDAQAKVLADTL